MSPTLVKVTVVPASIRIRAGEKLYSSLFAPILTSATPLTIGIDAVKMAGDLDGIKGWPAIVGGGGGGHRGPTFPFRSKAQTASPSGLPIDRLPALRMARYRSPSPSST